mgnify:CR=1 FL=1
MNTNSKQVKDKDKPLTVKIELHRVDPYKIMWVGEKKFFRKGQEETFVRFIIDKEGDQIGAFTYEEKKFVTPFHNRMGMAPDIIEDEPSGAAPIESGTEESRYDNMGGGF